MLSSLPYALPAILTALFNVLFYLIIKKSIDNSIERYKITYSGVFKEKIDIYKNLLAQVHDIKLRVNQYQATSDENMQVQIMKENNNFIRSYLINRPFLSRPIVENCKCFTLELQSIFDVLVVEGRKNYSGMSQDEIEVSQKKYWNAVNLLRENKSLGELEDAIVQEMRKDLKLS